MKILTRFLDVLEKILLKISGLLLAVMVIVICKEVVARYVFHSADSYSEEIARYSMEWIVMFVSPVAFRRHRHTRVDFFTNKIPEKVMPFLQLILYILILVFIFVLGYKGRALVKVGSRQISPGLRIPMSVMYSSQVIGPIFMALFVFECIVYECIIPIWKILRGGE